MGVYRMHLYDGNKTGMHWQIGKGGGYHYLQAEEQNKSLPVAVAVGADPILMLCGVLPLPENISEIAFAGFLRVRTNACRPNCETADSDRSGRIGIRARRVRSARRAAHGRPLRRSFRTLFVGRAVSDFQCETDLASRWRGVSDRRRRKAKSRRKIRCFGDAIQEMMLPLLKLMHPEMTDLWAYQEAGFHNLLVIAVKQRFDKEAIKTALWALGEGQLALTKCVILVDANVSNAHAVFPEVLQRAIRNNFNPVRHRFSRCCWPRRRRTLLRFHRASK